MSESPPDNNPLAHALALPVAVAAISFAAILFRLSFPTHPIVAAGLRLLIAAAALLPWTVRGVRRAGFSSPLVRRGTLAGVFYAAHFGAWVTSLTMTSVAASVTLVTVTPILLALVSVATGRDRPGGALWGALGVALVGLALISRADGLTRPEALAGDALAILGACAMAGYMLTARSMGPGADWPAFSGLATLTGGLVLALAALVAGVPLRPSGAAALGFIALAALIPQLVGHNLLTWSLRRAPPMAVSMAVVGEPAGATLLAWLLLSEPPTPAVALGCALTLFAVILSVRAAGVSRPERRG